MPHYPTHTYLVLILLIVPTLVADFTALAASSARPFWTEKSSYVEGEDLYVVGVASQSRTVEEGRLKAFEHGKIELMNFAQVTDLEAQGLMIETQMTHEEPNPDGTVMVFRLLRVSLPKLLEIQRSRTAKLEQQQKEVTQLLDRLSGQSAPRPHPQAPLSLTEQLRATEALLDEREREMRHVSQGVRERVKREQEKYQARCKHLVRGMDRAEIKEIMGQPLEIISRSGGMFFGDIDIMRIPSGAYQFRYGQVDPIEIHFSRGILQSMEGCSSPLR
jgi:hypothetical protein